MDFPTDNKIDIPHNESTEYKLTTDITPSQPPEETDLPNIVVENTKLGNDEETQKVKEINDEKLIENSSYIAMRVYDTYYGQQQPQQPPHQQQPFQRQPIHPQFQSQWGGGGGYYGGEALTYDPASRNYFVKLVFTILLTMVLVTSAFIAMVIATDSVKNTFRRHSLLFYIVGFVLLLICHYGIYLSPCARAPPCNILILVLAVVAFCIIAGNVSARYKTQLVLYAAMATTVVVLVCLLLACTKFDFTSWLLYVVVIASVFAAISLILFAVSLISGKLPKPLHIAMLVIGTILQVVILVIELQMILGGKSVELNEDEYALGAFMLYTSIMTLFINLLQLIGLTN